MPWKHFTGIRGFGSTMWSELWLPLIFTISFSTMQLTQTMSSLFLLFLCQHSPIETIFHPYPSLSLDVFWVRFEGKKAFWVIEHYLLLLKPISRCSMDFTPVVFWYLRPFPLQTKTNRESFKRMGKHSRDVLVFLPTGLPIPTNYILVRIVPTWVTTTKETEFLNVAQAKLF